MTEVFENICESKALKLGPLLSSGAFGKVPANLPGAISAFWDVERKRVQNGTNAAGVAAFNLRLILSSPRRPSVLHERSAELTG